MLIETYMPVVCRLEIVVLISHSKGNFVVSIAWVILEESGVYKLRK